MISNHQFFHWFYFNKNKKHYFNIGSGLFIWLFLSITQPFGIYENNLSSYWLLTLFLFPFGAIFSLVSYFTDFISVQLFKLKIKEEFKIDFKIWGIKLLILIHLFYLIRNLLCDGTCIDLGEYLQLWVACIILFGFTYFPFMIYAKYLYFHQMVGTNPKAEDEVELIGEGKEKLLLERDKIIYFKSDDNYVEIFILKNENKIEKKLFRVTLKSVQDQLVNEQQFIRIHRSYFINLHFVNSYKNKNSLEIKFGNKIAAIPVSKKYEHIVSQIFNHPK